MAASSRGNFALRGAVGLAISIAAVAGPHARRSRCPRIAFLSSLCRSRPGVFHTFERTHMSSVHCRIHSLPGKCSAVPKAAVSMEVASTTDGDNGIARHSSSAEHGNKPRKQCREARKQMAFKTRALVGKARRDAISGNQGEYRINQDILEGKRTRFVSRVMYDGTNYSGSQLQQNGEPTIQVSLSVRWHEHTHTRAQQ